MLRQVVGPYVRATPSLQGTQLYLLAKVIIFHQFSTFLCLLFEGQHQCVAVPQNGNYFLLKGKVFPFSPIITLMQGKPAGNHHGAERDGGGKNQDRKALVVLQ